MNRKQLFILGLDTVFLVVSTLCINFTYKLIENSRAKAVIILVLLFLSLFLIIKEIYGISKAFHKQKKASIPYVIGLIGEQEQVVQVWDLNRQIGLLIGKSTELVDADIDLSSAEFSSYIDNEHATLNYTTSGWWVEDLGSVNGTVVKRKNKEFLLSSGSPSKLLAGDIIVIGENTRLAVN